MSLLFKNVHFILIVLLSACTHQSETKYQSYENYWMHLECGAGNYGLDGHTKKSQRRTVLQQFNYISPRQNYIDELPEKDLKAYDPTYQYAVLFWTLEQLIEKFGDHGIFHVNDLHADYAEYAANQLNTYAKSRGYTHIIIETIPGDYKQINSMNTLSSYGRQYYDSVHLKNPEITFYHFGMDGDLMLSHSKSRSKARLILQHLANLSTTGLYFFTLDISNVFIPHTEKQEFIVKHIFYLPTSDWSPVPYYMPDGVRFDLKYNKVYFIAREPYH